MAGAQVMCEVSKADIQAHVAERLEREHAEKERRRREKLEAHLYLQVWAPCYNYLIYPRFSTNRVGRGAGGAPVPACRRARPPCAALGPAGAPAGALAGTPARA